MVRIVLFDLDGVIRHFNAQDVAAIESCHGLAEGALGNAAFSQPLLSQVTTGLIQRGEWVRRIGERVGNASAAVAWSRIAPSIDHEVLHLVDELRDLGMTAAVLTNGTDTVTAELEVSGVDRHFDAIFNSAEIGYAKPHALAFEYVLRALDCTAAEIFFTDDSAAKLDGAQALGMSTHRFTGSAELRTALWQAGVRVPSR